MHSRPPRSGQLYVATEFAEIKAAFKQMLMLRLQMGAADVVVVPVDVDVLVTVVRVVDAGVPVLVDCDALLLGEPEDVVADDEDVPTTVVRLEMIRVEEELVMTEEVLLVVGEFGHVGSRMMTLTGPPRASQTPFSSPALIAAETSAGVMLSPMTSLSPIRTVAILGPVLSSCGTSESN